MLTIYNSEMIRYCIYLFIIKVISFIINKQNMLRSITSALVKGLRPFPKSSMFGLTMLPRYSFAGGKKDKKK